MGQSSQGHQNSNVAFVPNQYEGMSNLDENFSQLSVNQQNNQQFMIPVSQQNPRGGGGMGMMSVQRNP